MANIQRLQTILQEVTAQAKALLGQQLESVILFGSYARGEETQDSDIDIMLILDCPSVQARMYRKRISHIASRIGLEYDVVISILVRTKAEFTQGIQYLPFYQNISREGISIYG